MIVFENIRKEQFQEILDDIVKFPIDCNFPRRGEYHLLYKYTSLDCVSFDVVTNHDNKVKYVLKINRGFKIELVDYNVRTKTYTPECWGKMIMQIKAKGFDVL